MSSPVSRRAAVLGSPIQHSLSPMLHRAAYVELGLDWTYDAYDVDKARLPGFLAELDGSWVGLSLTMPLKHAVIPLLDEVSPLAAQVEAVNTVSLTDGRRSGDNTDVPGMVAALHAHRVSRVTSVAILGGGATARSAFAAVRDFVGSGAPSGEVTGYLRRPERAASLRQLAERLNQHLTVAPWQAAAAGLRADLVIATTPAGATDSLADSIPPQPGILVDVVYHPWPTRIAAAWQAAGGTVISGLDLLVHQAALQVQLMTGQPAPLAAMRTAGQTALVARNPRK